MLYNKNGDLMKKVIIGMSGGVDSSVAAYLLKKDGYEVIGVTLLLCDSGKEDTLVAKNVCDKLGIRHIVAERKELFKTAVIMDFIRAYENGETPNPCVICNAEVKIEEMLKIANELGADYVATGHYSSIVVKDGKHLIKRPADLSKDQTYMLYRLTEKQLSRVLMPLSDYTKEQVREIAKELDLSSADRPDSQDICFIPDGNYKGFIENFTGKKYPEGDFVLTDGKVVGKHKGIIGYTVGQRKGLGIALGKPAFVVSKNKDKNEVVLSDNEELLFTTTVNLHSVNIIGINSDDLIIPVTAKLRYRHKDSPAILTLKGNTATLEFKEPQRAAASGQSAVFYQDDILIGGGIIK